MDGRLYGAIVLEIAPGSMRELQRALRSVHWGSAWLVDHFRREQLAERDAKLRGLTTATDLMATALQEPGFGPSAIDVVNELAAKLNCDRVSLGVERGGDVEVKAISHTATFDRKSDLVRFIGQAMEEVIDLGVALSVPQAGDDLVALAHVEAARELKSAAICSVPLIDDGHAFGVITLERGLGEPFGPDDIDLLKTLGLLLGPAFALKLRNERGPIARFRESFYSASRAVFGPRHPGVKLIAAAAVIVVTFFSLFVTDHRVTARTVVEGEVQRAVAAPFEGFIAESLVRAGDSVTKGQVMARLEEKDLRLEQTRWQSEKEQADRKFRAALAEQDRAAMAVVAAQANQAEAQLQLVEERLSRSRIVAPFDGIVVSGDLSQLLGTPVEQGKMLFEVAPLDRYRVILKVDERDINFVKIGQPGDLVLSGLPGEAMKFSVKAITPVSTPLEGHNYFRAEAQLADSSARLRPGMEGVGKVLVGRARLIWIWTHSLTDWIRLTLWNWLP
jgi:RND family efflux transporter MFP subunit